MSDVPFGSYPQGRQLADAPRPFGDVLLPASDATLAWASKHFLELQEDDLDFTRSHRKIYDREGGYFRMYLGTPQTAESAGVSHYIVRDGFIVLLRRPNSEKVESTLVGEGMVGRKLGANEPLGTPGWR